MSNRIKTKLGYIKSSPRPTQEYLNNFYQNLYFKEGVTVTYNNKYSKRRNHFLFPTKDALADCLLALPLWAREFNAENCKHKLTDCCERRTNYRGLNPLSESSQQPPLGACF